MHRYDLVLNSTLLGEERCAELIARAAQLKRAALGDAALSRDA